MRTLLFCLLTFSLELPALELSPNDISILMPLPKTLNVESVFRPTTMGQFGELLPHRVFSRLPRLESASDEKTFRSLRVVAVRLDPCFPTLPGRSDCQAQIRLVWQPIVKRTMNTTLALDAAVHTFYNLSAGEFHNLVTEIKNAKTSLAIDFSNEPLSIHPVLQKEGLDGEYSRKLRGILLGFLGEQRMVRITFMALKSSTHVWTFGGFDLVAELMQPLIIPRVGGDTQTFFRYTKNSTEFQNSGASPEPKGTDIFNLLYLGAQNIRESDQSEVTRGAIAATRIENPRLYNVHSVDCVSCHTAQTARIWAFREYPMWNLAQLSSPYIYKSEFNLQNISAQPAHTGILRGFGYFNNQPAISQRVIHETAHALELLKSSN